MRKRNDKARGSARLSTLIGLLLLVVMTGVWGCEGWADQTPQPSPAAKGDAAGLAGAPGPKPVFLKQNWTPEESREFYYKPQGSQILPYDWFLVLEQADNTSKFRDDSNLLKFGYLHGDAGPQNPDVLPVGFTKGKGRDREWLGLTCAACHTGQVEYKGVSIRIDGGPSLSDVRAFLFGVTDALKATRDQPAKFDRFAKKVRGDNVTPADKATLTEQLGEIIKQREGYNVRNFPKDSESLPGRVDAFGAILNEVFHRIAKLPADAPYDANTSRADAAVSYPCLWDTPQHDVVQWNGAASNAGIGALGRNVGEVLGVFGKFEIPDPPGILGYASTVEVNNLRGIEQSLTSLWSPLWPDDLLPPIDKTLLAAGRKAYEKAKCQVCHDPDFNRADKNRKVVAKMVAVGTEDRMAVNFLKRFASTGKLEGAFVKVLGVPGVSPRFKAKAGGEEVLSNAVIGTILGSGFRAPEDELSKIDYKRKKAETLGAEMSPLIGNGGIYKARPLNGIWATAPYLHNGSVPTLADMLLPGKDRPKSFTVGSREFDPKRVGFRTDAPGYPTFVARHEDGTPVAGNSNEGHEFGTEFYLDKDERLALLEYLKSL